MYIERHLSSVINRAMDTFPSVLVTGARQVGKSTLLKNIVDADYYTFDDYLILDRVKKDPLGFVREIKPPIILDEVQYAPEVFRGIKLRIDEHRNNGDYLMTGSQAFRLMQGVSESLAGRVSIFNLQGLSFRELDNDRFRKPFIPTDEYLNMRKPIGKIDFEKLWQRIHRGSFPELYANETINWNDFYSSYVKTYIERDVRDLTQVGNELSFMQFITALAARVGELLNFASIARDVGVSEPTIKKWVSILETSNIIYLLQPFSLNITTRAAKTPKVYFFDTGLVCYLCKWNTPEQLQNGAQAENIFENAVVNEIRKSYLNEGEETPIYFYRDNNAIEIDLIFYENGTIYPIEIKKTTTPNEKDIKTFKVLETAFPSLKIGHGGILCTYDKVLTLNGKNKIIPINYI